MNAKNLGPTDFKCGGAGGACSDSDVTYVVSYGPATAAGVALAYNATGCTRVAGHDNTQLSCSTVPGVGINHVWEIAVTTHGSDGAKRTVSQRSVMTSSYRKPTLTTVGASSKNIPTVGGVTLTFVGTDLGPIIGTAPSMFYVSNAGAVVGGTTIFQQYAGVGCKVTVDSTTIECVAAPGVGTNVKYCLVIGSQYTSTWCENYVTGAAPPNTVSHTIVGGGSSNYALPTITAIDGTPYDRILSSSDGATNTAGVPRVNTIMEVSLLEPMLTQDIWIVPSTTAAPVTGAFHITYDGHASSCVDVTTMTDGVVQDALVEVLEKANVANAVGKIQSVVLESLDNGHKWVKILLAARDSTGGASSFTLAKAFNTNTSLTCALDNGFVSMNTASWGSNPWGTNGESGAYFTLTLPGGCEYCKDRDPATTGKIYPGKNSGPNSLQYELESLPGIGTGMLTVVQTSGSVGEGYVWTITFSGDTVMGDMPLLVVEHTIEADDVVARNSTNRHRIEKTIESIGGEQKLSTRVVTTGRIGGLRARGGDTIDIVGTNYGPRGTAVYLYYGPAGTATRYTATQCDVIVDHVRMKCVSTSGVGKDHVSVVRAGGQLSTAEFSTTHLFYRPPSILSVGGSGATASTTAGGASIVITGSDFGPRFTSYTQPCTFETDPVSTQPETALVAADLAVHYGHAPNATVISGVNYGAECCVVESDERMVCRTTQGTGLNHAWTIRVGGQWSTVNKAGTSYGQPIIVSYDNFPSQLVPNVNDFNTTGGEPVVIVGKNLGHLLWKIEFVSYGMLSDEEFHLDTTTCVLQNAHTMLRCYMAPGAGVQMTWRVVVDGQASVYPTIAFGPPQVHSFSLETSSVLQSSTCFV